VSFGEKVGLLAGGRLTDLLARGCERVDHNDSRCREAREPRMPARTPANKSSDH
jgi:hypothetical protein